MTVAHQPEAKATAADNTALIFASMTVGGIMSQANWFPGWPDFWYRSFVMFAGSLLGWIVFLIVRALTKQSDARP